MELISPLIDWLNANTGITVIFGLVIMWVYFNHQQKELLKERLEHKTDEAKSWERKYKEATDNYQVIFKTSEEQKQTIERQKNTIALMQRDLTAMQLAKLNQPVPVSGATATSGTVGTSILDYLGKASQSGYLKPKQ